jgi:hypothetical protein
MHMAIYAKGPSLQSGGWWRAPLCIIALIARIGQIVASASVRVASGYR